MYAEDSPSTVRIRLLGRFRVAVNGEPLSDGRWKRRKSKLLIKLLALQPHHQLHREQLIELLWPEQESEPVANNLHKVIHAARRALEPALASGLDSRFVRWRDQQIALVAGDGLWIDVDEFETRAAEALRGDDPESYEAALALYEGDLLAEDLYEDWAGERREQLRVLQHGLLMKLSGLYANAGDCQRGLALSQQLIALDALNEEAWRQSMRLLARQGKRAEALRQYERCCQVLRAELDAEIDPATAGLFEQIVAGRLSSASPCQRGGEQETHKQPVAERGPAGNLPSPMTSFVGRAGEMARVRKLLRSARLLTLTGAGGMGKTRCAIEVAAALTGEYADGVYLADLSAVNDPALVARTVAVALGLPERPNQSWLTTLSDFLRHRRLLLLFDNCEHLVEPSATLARELLSACPTLRILATSRESLGLPGEVVWPLAALSLPGRAQSSSVAEALNSEAIQLFCERARMCRPAWELTHQNAAAVASICLRLDGIPLAIELAAARVRVLTAGQILERLDNSFRLLTNGDHHSAPRHQTLRATLDWSYDLLAEDERGLLRLLSLFAGGATLEAVEGCYAGCEARDGYVLDLITRLVNKSLVTVDEGGSETRFRLLETIRQYAAEKLREAGETAEASARFAAWFLKFAERAAHHFASISRQREWFARTEGELDNLRFALHWNLQRKEQAEDGLRLSVALWRFWQARGYTDEGIGRLRSTLARAGAAPPLLRAEALFGIGSLLILEGKFGQAQTLLEECLALNAQSRNRQGVADTLHLSGRVAVCMALHERGESLLQEALNLYYELTDRTGIGRSLNSLGALAWYQGDGDRAAAHWEEALRCSKDLDHPLRVSVLNNLGLVTLHRGQPQRAEELLTQSLDLARELGEKRWETHPLHSLIDIALDRADHLRALQLSRQALALEREIGDAAGIAYVLEGFACVAAGLHDAERALRLAAAAATLRETIKAVRPPAEQAHLEKYLNSSKRILPPARVEQAVSQGRIMTLAEAIDYALEPTSVED